MNCGQCINWDLRGSQLRSAGFGLCKVEPDRTMRSARMFGPQHACTLDKFEKAPIATLKKREKVLGA